MTKEEQTSKRNSKKENNESRKASQQDNKQTKSKKSNVDPKQTTKRQDVAGLDAILGKKADNWFAEKIRKAVSRNKRRFIDEEHDFNLDLTCFVYFHSFRHTHFIYIYNKV
ncbi:hypothetical protein RFI_00525 [Reticulomyxa filosa]|uniref:Uncharacterized protein n=1 Tax=Reticulomyxa filosa TaxID=46433 RepID=X6PFS2_RETFI|nr:hypothetical protein RFI_00525 [Reticulomyxa filosa]|eukprot:ETO36537.1 hypothetical protein RFI_00525 [Reticulomyxa filosa]